MQYGIEMYVFHFCDRTDVSGDQCIGFDEILTLHQISVSHFEGFAPVADKELRVLRNGLWCTVNTPTLPTNGSIVTLNT